MSRPTSPAYKTRNWPAYNEALKRRGSLTIWFDPEMAWEAAPTGKRGRQPDYSDAAIQTCLTKQRASLSRCGSRCYEADCRDTVVVPPAEGACDEHRIDRH